MYFTRKKTQALRLVKTIPPTPNFYSKLRSEFYFLLPVSKDDLGVQTVNCLELAAGFEFKGLQLHAF